MAEPGMPDRGVPDLRGPDLPGQSALLRLLTWLSPAFPVGSFSYSHGLEMAAQDEIVRDAATLGEWLGDLLAHGSAWNDAVLVAEAWRRVGEGGDVADVAHLGEAMAGSLERHRETMLQGGAFLKAASAWPHPLLARLPAECSYPVAVGAVAGAHGVPLEAALAAFLQGFVSNQVQAAIRLGVLGQTDAMATMAGLEPLLAATAARAAHTTLEEIGSCTILAEIAAMKHETQYSRLFRS